MFPRTYPCKGFSYDASNPSDPYWTNPPITANFDDFVSWSNFRTGAIAGSVGDVRFNNMKVVDNRRAGIEFSDTSSLMGEYAQVNGALIVGRSNNADGSLLDWSSPIGFVPPALTAGADGFALKNARFYNFDWAYT